jgi:hypothetical protein
VKRLLAIFTGKHQPDRETISAYLDGQLAPARVTALDAHIASCENCRDELERLRELRATLRAMPVAEAPRSFRLTPSQAGARAAIPAPPPMLMRAMPALTAAALVVFAITGWISLSDSGADGDNGALARFESAGNGVGLDYEAASPSGGAAFDSAGDSAEPPAPGALAPDDSTADAQVGESAGAITPATPEAAARANDQDTAPTTNAGDPQTEATSAIEEADDDGNNLVLRIVLIASAAVALVAGAVTLRNWRKQGDGA